MGQTQGAHVLVIDDSLEMQTHLRRILEADGYRISVARSPREARRVGRGAFGPGDRGPNAFDLVVVHDDLTGVDGVWALKMLRRTTRYPSFPAILISSSQQQIERAEAMPWSTKNGVTCLQKPFDVERFLFSIEEALVPPVFRSSAPPSMGDPVAHRAAEAGLAQLRNAERRPPAASAKLHDEAGRRIRHTPAYGGFYA